MSPLWQKMTAVAFASALSLAGTATAAPINTALSVVIDGSGSISSGEFSTQRNAYANVLGDSSILPADGSVVINLIQFATSTQLEQTALRVSSEADRTTLLGAINGMTQLGGTTNIGGGIDLGVSNMDTFLSGETDFSNSFTKLVDVSTDGNHNTGTSPVTATSNAVNSQGYAAVNCLGIGSGADCSWNNGPDGVNGTSDDLGQDFSANSFAELQPVLTDKIGTELGTIPVPAPLALVGIGLVAMGFTRRKVA